MNRAYKFLRAGLKSDYDGSAWTVGEWRTVQPPTEACVGLNASLLIPEALRYVQGEILAEVEYDGVTIDSGDKFTCERMRVVRAWDWTPRMSVQLAVFAARQAIDIYRRYDPTDDRPQRAIDAAQAWLDKPTDTAAYAARAAADAAAFAARAAAVPALCAADAAADAAGAGITQRCHDYIMALLDGGDDE